MLKFKCLLPSLIFLTLLNVNVTAQDTTNELGLYEKLDQYLPKDLVFVDENYDTVNLVDAIDKPTVIVPVYYTCPGLCSPLLEGIADLISSTSLDLGKDYQVFTISFNPVEKTRLALKKKATYVKLVKTDADVKNGWTFFTGDSVNIARLLNSIGYKVKKQGKDFIHPGAIVIVSPKAKITRYLHGTYFLPFDLKMAVVEASEGKSGPTINRVLQFCFSYDPKGQKYVFNITKVSGGLILFFAVLFLITLIVKKRKNTKTVSDK